MRKSIVTEKSLITEKWYRTDVFQIVDIFPWGYSLWNIGRQNFPFEGYIPLARSIGEFEVDVTTLKTIKVESEEIALKLFELSMSGKKIDKTSFNEEIKKMTGK